MRIAIALTLLLSAAALAACSGGNSHVSSSSPPPAGGGIPTPTQHTDVVTYKNDPARTGQNLTESVLTPSNVNASHFGLLRMLAADGNVDATPLYLSGLTVQGATHNVVFWHVSLLGSGETVDDLPSYGCQQVAPTIGITATPVIDRSAGAHGIIYLVAMSRSSAANTYHQRLHALDVTSGAELLGGPVEIAAGFPTLGGTTVFDPAQYEERAALLLVNGTLYSSWTSHCDMPPYSGWIIAYSASTLGLAAVLNVAPNGGGVGPAIWMRCRQSRPRAVQQLAGGQRPRSVWSR